MPNHKLTITEILKRFCSIHGNTYDYSRVEYKTIRDKINIICKVHGEFLQEPNDHLAGRGCPKCGYEKAGPALISQKEIIERFLKIHGKKYDYSKVNYLGYRRKIEILCPIHGSFHQAPGSHLIGRGCRKCSTNKLAKSRRLDKEEILNRLKIVHGGKYNYTNSIFRGVRTKIEIVCPIHSTFKQVLGDHLSGRGCPKCPPNKKRYKNTHLYTDSLNEIRFLRKLEEKNGSLWLVENVRIPNSVYYTYNGKKRKYFPDYQINNTLYEIKSHYSWFEYKRHKKLDQINTAKLNAAKEAGYDVILVLDGIEMIWPVSVLKSYKLFSIPGQFKK